MVQGGWTLKSDMIYQQLIQLDMSVKDSDEFFERMAVKLVKLGFVKPSFLDAIKMREARYPTALPIEPYAVAIPHAEPEHIIKPFIAATRLASPIKWCEMAANDIEHDVKFIFMLGFLKSDEHVELLQILVANFQDSYLMKGLIRAKTETEYMNLLLSMKGL